MFIANARKISTGFTAGLVRLGICFFVFKQVDENKITEPVYSNNRLFRQKRGFNKSQFILC